MDTPTPATTAPPDPPTSQPTVLIHEVTKSFGPKVAVDNLSLAIYPHEVFAFLGPNGAGKTTTLKITTGLLRPDRGHVAVCEHRLDIHPQLAKQRIAYVPDQPFVYEKLTGREFLSFTREMYGVPPDVADQRLGELTHSLAMGGFLDQLCETYSHGMSQKVALAAALIHNPSVLIVDEPMVGLDPRTARVIKEIFRQRADAGGTVFMSTHTLDVAEQVADRIGIIFRGKLVALGTLCELRRIAAVDGRLEDVFLRLTEESDETTPE